MSFVRGPVVAFGVLAAALASPAAQARCREAIALLPLDQVAAARAEAVAAEATLREALERLVPGCAHPRAETVGKLKALGGRLPACADDACRSEWVKKLGARWVVQGSALAVGGEQTAAIALWGERGESGRKLVKLAAGAPGVQAALGELWGARSPRPAAPPRLGLMPHVTLGSGVAMLGAGIAVGIWAKQTEAAVTAGNAGCPAENFSACFDQKLEAGRAQALWANALLVSGGLVAASGAVLLVWTWP